MTAIIATASGKALDLLNPDPENVTIEEIAMSLSRECRFHNQTGAFYSVAQHCLEVSALCSTWEGRIWGLLHDAGEAYYGDLTTQLKAQPMIQDFWAYMEMQWLKMFAAKYQLTLPMPPEVKSADLVMLSIERKALLPDTEEVSNTFAYVERDFCAPFRVVAVLTQTEAGLRYTRTFHKLMAERPQQGDKNV